MRKLRGEGRGGEGDGGGEGRGGRGGRGGREGDGGGEGRGGRVMGEGRGGEGGEGGRVMVGSFDCKGSAHFEVTNWSNWQDIEAFCPMRNTSGTKMTSVITCSKQNFIVSTNTLCISNLQREDTSL